MYMTIKKIPSRQNSYLEINNLKEDSHYSMTFSKVPITIEFYDVIAA